MNPSRWRVLYDNGDWASSDEHSFWEVPRVGVQAVLQAHHEVGVEIVHSPDGYWIWKDNAWFGTDREGMYDYLRTHLSPEICVLQGRWVSHDRWREIQALVAEAKTARFHHEREVPDG